MLVAGAFRQRKSVNWPNIFVSCNIYEVLLEQSFHVLFAASMGGGGIMDTECGHQLNRKKPSDRRRRRTKSKGEMFKTGMKNKISHWMKVGQCDSVQISTTVDSLSVTSTASPLFFKDYICVCVHTCVSVCLWVCMSS